MKSLLSKSVLIFCCLILTSTNLFSQDGDVKKKIKELNNAWLKATLSDDLGTLLSYHTDDAILLPSYEPMLKGKTAILESNKKSKEAGFKINAMTLTTTDVWSSGNLAFAIGTYTINITIPGMSETIDDNGKYLTVYQKQADGSWKIKADTWNSDNNPWEDMGMAKDDMEDDMEKE